MVLKTYFPYILLTNLLPSRPFFLFLVLLLTLRAGQPSRAAAPFSGPSRPTRAGEPVTLCCLGSACQCESTHAILVYYSNSFLGTQAFSCPLGTICLLCFVVYRNVL